MKRFLVREARAAFPNLLDAAERGEAVVIERRGVLFTLSTVSPKAARGSKRAARVARVDDALLDGEWTWDWTPDGLAFRDRHS